MIIEIVVTILIVVLAWGLVSQIRPSNFPPGPLGQFKLGGLPFLGYMPFLSPNPYRKIGKIGKKYGGIFSFKMGDYWIVVLNDYETIKNALRLDIFSGRPNHLLGMKFFPKGIAFNSGPACLHQRRFALKALKDLGFARISMEDLISQDVEILVDYLKLKTNQPLGLMETFAVAAINGMWRILSGEVFDLDDPEFREVTRAVKEDVSNPDVHSILYFMPWLSRIFAKDSGLDGMMDGVIKLRKLLSKTIDAHKSSFVPGAPARDYIDMYLQQIADTTDPDSSFYKEEGDLNMVDSLMNLFIAASDTISSTLSFSLLYLGTHKDKLEKIQAEIDQVVQDRLPNLSDKVKMPYTEATMAEILRLSSIVPGAILHSTLEDVDFMGYHLPKGTTIMPNLYQVHHDEDTWGDPENFRPERFLNEDGTFRRDERVIPFSVGRRMCIGDKLGMIEFFLFLTGILQNFDLAEHPDHPLPGLYGKSGFVLSPNPYKIMLLNRK